MKHCLKCQQEIDENNHDEKYCMIITKRGDRIIAFECFHFNCWKQFWDESVRMAACGDYGENRKDGKIRGKKLTD